MNTTDINEVLNILQDEKRCYYHYEHGYVHLLVSRWREQFNNSPFHQQRSKLATVADFRASKYGRWQHLPLIKQWLAGHGGRNAVLKPLPHIGLSDSTVNPMGYAITFDKWGSEDKNDIWWNQTSRIGYNLVVQLNLPLDVLRTYQNMKIDDPAMRCQSFAHPSHKKRMTLAWARLDIDLINNQVLIEEIQSDWVGELAWSLQRAQRIFGDNDSHPEGKKHMTTFTYRGSDIRCQHYIDTMKTYYRQYKNTWANMILTATFEFIWQALDADMQVFYHQYDYGCQIKSCSPPRSLYSTVPEKLGFKVTELVPDFLTQDKPFQKKVANIKKQHPNMDMRFYRI